MPVGGGLPTRRRANSSTSGGGGDNNNNSSIAASRPKRRTGRGGSPSPANSPTTSLLDLVATTNGSSVLVHLIVNGERFVASGGSSTQQSKQMTATPRSGSSRKRSRSQDTTTPTQEEVVSPAVTVLSIAEKDHNLFHCHVCSKFGDVVCCDNCPHVYHKQCIPEEEPSRVSLDNDEDPWFCPSCHPDSTERSRLCFVCGLEIPKADSEKLPTCTGCGGWVHSECILEMTPDDDDGKERNNDAATRPPLICDKCQEARTANKPVTVSIAASKAAEAPISLEWL